MKMNSLHLLGVVIFISSSLLGCGLDSYNFSIENASDYPVAVSALKVDDFGIIKSKEIVFKKVNGKTSSFKVLILKNNIVSTYQFRDVDHWFGTTHDILIKIDNETNTLEGSGSTRFDEERNY